MPSQFPSVWWREANRVTAKAVAEERSATGVAMGMRAARCWTNQEIGEHMNVSANTVKAHISQAIKKLNVENRKSLKKHMLR